MSSRRLGLKSPSIATPRCATTGDTDVFRVAEIMSSSQRGPRAASPLVSIAPVSVPSWHDAITQLSVNHSVQGQLEALVQPRLDGFAERLGDIVASVQNEMRELWCLVEGSEARVGNQLSGFETRLAALADGAARTEQREKELNIRIAGVADNLLKQADGGAHEAVVSLRFEELGRHLQEDAARLKTLEETCRKRKKAVDERIQKLEEHSRSLPRLADDLREVAVATARAAVAAACPGTGQEQVPVAANQWKRVAVLEEQVRVLSFTASAGGDAISNQALANQLSQCTHEIRAQVIAKQEEHREVLSNQLSDSLNELRTQVIAKQEEYKEAMSARIDDMNLRLGALKVKADGLDSRLHSGFDRVERVLAERTRELEMQQKPIEVEEQMVKRFGKLASDIGVRLEAFANRLETLEMAAEEAEKQQYRNKPSMLNRPQLDKGIYEHVELNTSRHRPLLSCRLDDLAEANAITHVR